MNGVRSPGITPNRATLRPDVSRSGLMEDRRGFAAGPLSEYWTPNWTPAATSQSPRIAKEPENSGSLLIGETGSMWVQKPLLDRKSVV